jgi:DNA-binding transcriptional regulator YiaG
MAAATLTLVSINSKAFDQRGRIVEKSTSPRKTDEIDEFIGAHLKKCRLAVGVSQGQLAAEVGVSYQQLHKYETGKNRISASRVYRLAVALRVPLLSFFPDIEEELLFTVNYQTQEEEGDRPCTTQSRK